MFGRSSMFDDPFFSTQDMRSDFDRMDRMMSNFHSGFGHPLALEGQRSNQRAGGGAGGNQRDMMMPFGGMLGGSMFGGSMFGSNMFGNMDAMMSQMQNSGGQSFSSSRVMTYSSDGSGAPKIYEATSEVTQGPDGVRQTRRSERNSETGNSRMAIGHHLYDRGHVVERSMNQRTNEREEKQDFINLDESERDSFHKEWQNKARSSRFQNTIDSRSHHPQQQRSLPSVQRHRSRERDSDDHQERVRHGGERHRDRSRHNSRSGNSVRFDEI